MDIVGEYRVSIPHTDEWFSKVAKEDKALADRARGNVAHKGIHCCTFCGSADVKDYQMNMGGFGFPPFLWAQQGYPGVPTDRKPQRDQQLESRIPP